MKKNLLGNALGGKRMQCEAFPVFSEQFSDTSAEKALGRGTYFYKPFLRPTTSHLPHFRRGPLQVRELRSV